MVGEELAPLMLAAGFQPFQVSRCMGHGGLDLLSRTYGHLYPSDYDAEIERSERFVNEG